MSRSLYRISSRLATPARLTRPLAMPAATREFSSTSFKAAKPALAGEQELDVDMSTRSAQQWADFGKEHVSHGLGRLKDLVVVKGSGLDVYTADGSKYLDFTAGIGVTNLGHCHPAVTEAAVQQAGTLVHMQCSIMFHDPYLQLIDRLLPAMPDPSLDSFFFWNSGSEAVEAALKLSRKATGRQNVIVMQGSYHGRTMASGAMSKSKTIYTQNTGPLMGGVYSSAFPYWHSLGVSTSTSEEELVRLAEFQLDLTLRQQTHPSDTAAIFVEPVQGEGGYVPCPPKFMQHLRKVCDKHGIMLVVDEVQSGFFRTGTYFAVEEMGARPDIMIFAKGVANGFPLSGIVANKSLMNTLDVGSIGGTYAGNAVACAAGVAVQEVYATGEVGRNVAARSEQMFSTLHILQKKHANLIVDVRGKGLMTAVEFRMASDPITHEGLPAGASIPKDIGKRVQKYCLDRGLMVLTTSCFDTIRFIPALVVSEEQMAQAMDIFTAAVDHVAKEG